MQCSPGRCSEWPPVHRSRNNLMDSETSDALEIKQRTPNDSWPTHQNLGPEYLRSRKICALQGSLIIMVERCKQAERDGFGHVEGRKKQATKQPYRQESGSHSHKKPSHHARSDSAI